MREGSRFGCLLGLLCVLAGWALIVWALWALLAPRVLGMSVETKRIELGLLPAQKTLVQDAHPFRAYVGGLGSGKTFVGSLIVVIEALRFPGSKNLVTANTHRQLRDPVIPMIKNALFLLGVHARFDNVDKTFILENGSTIVCRSVTNVEDLRGAEYDFWWPDEVRDYKVEAIDTCIGRLRGKKRPRCGFVMTTTPAGYDEVWRLFEFQPTADHFLVTAPTRQNIFLPPNYERDLREKYKGTPELVDQELEGKFTSLKGSRCYKAFDLKKHASKPCPYVPFNERTQTANPLFLTFDFNVSPFVCLAIQEVHNPKAPLLPIVHVVGEVIRRDAGVPDIAEAVLQRFGKHAGRVEINGDSKETGRNCQTGRTTYALLREALAQLNPRERVPPQSPPVIDRVNSVNYLLAHDRLFIDPSCRLLIEDLSRVSWDRETGGIDKSNLELTHASDALSYRTWIAHRPQVFRADKEAMARFPR